MEFRFRAAFLKEAALSRVIPPGLPATKTTAAMKFASAERGIALVISPRSNRTTIIDQHREACKRRNLIERRVNRGRAGRFRQANGEAALSPRIEAGPVLPQRAQRRFRRERQLRQPHADRAVAFPFDRPATTFAEPLSRARQRGRTLR